MSERRLSAMHDTIAAIATPPGAGGVGVIRVSGDTLSELGLQLMGKRLKPRQATMAVFRDADGQPIDHGIALFFTAPHSYTGEDVLEIQVHGSMVVLNMLLERLIELGARLAGPGEFTKRAFLNGKLDLVQAESVADLIAATTQSAARAATRSLSGQFSEKIHAFSEVLIDIRMHVEAAIDFSDEEIDFLPLDAIFSKVVGLKDHIAETIQSARQGVLLRDGIRIALVGRPNVGKSSLLNSLLGENRAIVTPIAGTTRDAISEQLSIDGIPVTLVDTAGLRETTHPVEKLGIERTWQEVNRAAVVLLVTDASESETDLMKDMNVQLPDAITVIHVHNKIDLTGKVAECRQDGSQTDIWLSARHGDGVGLLKQAILAAIGVGAESEAPFIARQRHLAALMTVFTYLEHALTQQAMLECAAEDLRLAHQALGEIVGEYTSDDLLGKIFADFCIGK